MNTENYLSELFSQLHCRGLDESRIADIISEVESHLEESAEKPEEAFGPAKEYAEKMAVFAEKSTTAMTADDYRHRTFRATAFDEMEILRWAGLEGWELVDVGPYALFCRRPLITGQTFHWEYIRRTGANRSKISREMAAENWETCGRWIVFHYFKRKVETLDQSQK
ncbi:MAG: hypothetical protein QNL91_01215 [Candidatus Krumholzibacteria bacterium]|nr:hypothetical protein [Candidatus Krumholzibacteria bacterium]